MAATEDIVEELQAVQAEIRRRKTAHDPVAWVKEKLGEDLWSKQREIMYSVRDNKRTAVYSCHQIGKSFISARIAAWWIDSHPPGEAKVLTTATDAAQVQEVLWAEMNRTFSKGKLAGRMTQTQWHMTMPLGHEEIVAVGRKPSDNSPVGFQGRHARYFLVIFDEASGIADGLWAGAMSLVGTPESRFLAIGNPDDSSGRFAQICKPGSDWKVIQIGWRHTPNATGEVIPEEVRHNLISESVVNDFKHDYGEDSPIYKAKIDGEFPETTKDGLIPMAWVLAAQRRNLEPDPKDPEAVKTAQETWPIELGVDVGGGKDKNVAALRRGPIVRVIRRDQEPDTMKSCGRMLMDMKANHVRLAKVDDNGIGQGLADRAKELDEPVIGVNVGSAAKNKEKFLNLRAEAYWNLRQRFQDGLIDLDPKDSVLAGQLVDIRYKPTSSGKIQIESKEDMKRRTKKTSPDEADAVMLAFLPEELCGPKPAESVEFVWG